MKSTDQIMAEYWAKRCERSEIRGRRLELATIILFGVALIGWLV